MSVEVTEQEFWRGRLVQAHVSGRGLHTAVFDVEPEEWLRIQDETAGLILRYVRIGDRILDVGCGYGAVRDCLPAERDIGYAGIDLSPDLIEIARLRHPDDPFVVGDARALPFGEDSFTAVVARSVRTMLVEHDRKDVWDDILDECLRVSPIVLVLEYGRHVGRPEPCFVVEVLRR